MMKRFSKRRPNSQPGTPQSHSSSSQQQQERQPSLPSQYQSQSQSSQRSVRSSGTPRHRSRKDENGWMVRSVGDEHSVSKSESLYSQWDNVITEFRQKDKKVASGSSKKKKSKSSSSRLKALQQQQEKKTRRNNFAILNAASPSRRVSDATMERAREHAKQLADASGSVASGGAAARRRSRHFASMYQSLDEQPPVTKLQHHFDAFGLDDQDLNLAMQDLASFFDCASTAPSTNSSSSSEPKWSPFSSPQPAWPNEDQWQPQDQNWSESSWTPPTFQPPSEPAWTEPQWTNQKPPNPPNTTTRNNLHSLDKSTSIKHNNDIIRKTNHDDQWFRNTNNPSKPIDVRKQSNPNHQRHGTATYGTEPNARNLSIPTDHLSPPPKIQSQPSPKNVMRPTAVKAVSPTHRASPPPNRRASPPPTTSRASPPPSTSRASPPPPTSRASPPPPTSRASPPPSTSRASPPPTLGASPPPTARASSPSNHSASINQRNSYSRKHNVNVRAGSPTPSFHNSNTPRHMNINNSNIPRNNHISNNTNSVASQNVNTNSTPHSVNNNNTPNKNNNTTFRNFNSSPRNVTPRNFNQNLQNSNIHNNMTDYHTPRNVPSNVPRSFSTTPRNIQNTARSNNNSITPRRNEVETNNDYHAKNNRNDDDHQDNSHYRVNQHNDYHIPTKSIQNHVKNNRNDDDHQDNSDYRVNQHNDYHIPTKSIQNHIKNNRNDDQDNSDYRVNHHNDYYIPTKSIQNHVKNNRNDDDHQDNSDYRVNHHNDNNNYNRDLKYKYIQHNNNSNISSSGKDSSSHHNNNNNNNHNNNNHNNNNQISSNDHDDSNSNHNGSSWKRPQTPEAAMVSPEHYAWKKKIQKEERHKQNTHRPPLPLEKERIAWLTQELGEELRTPERDMRSMSPQRRSSPQLQELDRMRLNMPQMGRSPMRARSEGNYRSHMEDSAAAFLQVKLRKSPRRERPTSSAAPSFVSEVKLRKTGAILTDQDLYVPTFDDAPSTSPPTVPPTAPPTAPITPQPQAKKERDIATSIRRRIATNQRNVATPKEPETPSNNDRDVAMSIRRRIAANRRNAKPNEPTEEALTPTMEEPQQQPQQQQPPAKKKLTYREQRELLKQQEEQNTPPPEEPKPRDIALSIKRRIAANRRNLKQVPPEEPAEPELRVEDFRSRLKKVRPPEEQRPAPTQPTHYKLRTNTPPRKSMYIRPSTPQTPQPDASDTKPSLTPPRTTQTKSPRRTDAKPPLSPPPRSPQVKQLTPPRSPQTKQRTPPRSPQTKQRTPPRSPQTKQLTPPRLTETKSLTPPRSKVSPKPIATQEEEDRRSMIPEIFSSQEVVPPEDTKGKLTALLKSRMGPSKDEEKSAVSALIAQRASKKEDPPVETAAPVVDTPLQPALKDDPKYNKYIKMLEVGLPKEAVKHCMERDGLDGSILDGNHNKPVGGVPLKQDPKFAKYFNMLKIGLPLGAVKNAMVRDGLDPNIMDMDHNAPFTTNVPSKPNIQQTKMKKDKFRRTRLHWETVSKVRDTSVWAMVNQDPDVEQIEIDENEFNELFQAEIGQVVAMKTNKSNDRKNAVKVIDPKRANNGGIILARLKMTYDDMAIAVDNIDENAMTAEQTQGIIEYIPTNEEKKKLREYMTQSDKDPAEAFDELCECEKFMVAMMTVKYSKQKVRALLFKLQFLKCVEDIQHETTTVEKACEELSNSVRLRKLLGVVLNIGNRLNTAGSTQKGKAGAFTIKSLLKLNQAKAFDRKTTFLHYVVLVLRRNNESLLEIKDDLANVISAEKIYWDQCVNDLEEVENQLENVRKIALYTSGHRSSNSKKDDDSLSDVSISIEEEVASLRSIKIGMFVLNSIKIVSALREQVENTKQKWAEVLEYFGEDEKSTMQPHELFNILVTFCKYLDVARVDVLREEKRKMREAKKNNKMKEKKSGETKSCRTEPPSANCEKATMRSSASQPNMYYAKKKPKKSMLRASAMQPNMSSLLEQIRKKGDISFGNVQSGSEPAQKPSHETPQQNNHNHRHEHETEEINPMNQITNEVQHDQSELASNAKSSQSAILNDDNDEELSKIASNKDTSVNKEDNFNTEKGEISNTPSNSKEKFSNRQRRHMAHAARAYSRSPIPFSGNQPQKTSNNVNDSEESQSDVVSPSELTRTPRSQSRQMSYGNMLTSRSPVPPSNSETSNEAKTTSDKSNADDTSDQSSSTSTSKLSRDQMRYRARRARAMKSYDRRKTSEEPRNESIHVVNASISLQTQKPSTNPLIGPSSMNFHVNEEVKVDQISGEKVMPSSKPPAESTQRLLTRREKLAQRTMRSKSPSNVEWPV